MDAPNWGLHVACSADVLLTGLEIKNSLILPNSDGIDVSLSRNVRISDCNITAGDDGIALSPCADGFGAGGCENVTVTNCVISSRSAAIRIGWGEHDFRNLVFNNIVIRDSNRGILIQLRRAETVENIVFSNLVIETRLYRGKWWGKGEPIHISALPEFADDQARRCLRNVTFSNVTATGDHGIVVYAGERSAIEDVRFHDVRVTIRPSAWQEAFGGNFDLRPTWDPARRVFAHDIAGLHASGVNRLSLRDVAVVWEGALPTFFRHAVEIENFGRITLDGLRAQPAPAARAGDAAVVLRHGDQAIVRHGVGVDDAGPWLEAHDVRGLLDEDRPPGNPRE